MPCTTCKKKILLEKSIFTKIQKAASEILNRLKPKEDFKSVGKGGVNNIEDIKYVLRLFNCVGVPAKQFLEICKDDWANCQSFHGFISDFQKKNFGWQDSLIEPSKPTIKALLSQCNTKKPKESDIKIPKIEKNPEVKTNNVTSGVPSFESMVALVIDKLEGGYYHPDMLRDGRIKDSRYGSSGETMMGIDRKNGGSLNRSEAGKKFWQLIDNENARENWKWGYRGGNLESPLRNLAGQMIKPKFFKNANRYLSDKARKIVLSNKKLLFNFIYATWNGSGWFQRFSKQVNKAVENGITDPEKLYKVAINARLKSSNSLIRQGGNKIASFLN